MIVVMRPESTKRHVDDVEAMLQRMGALHCVGGPGGRVLEVFNDAPALDVGALRRAPMVDRVLDQSVPLLAADRQPGETTRTIPLGEAAHVGGSRLAVIAGPCSVESESQLIETALAVKQAGAVALRAGAFKPRTSPYTFQGHGEKALEMLARARERTGLAVVTEVMRCEHVELVARYADVLQVGSRNMHNTHLLSAVGAQEKPVLLKRSWSATIEELLQAAEYILLEGNSNVILCERGIRTYERFVRNTLSLAIVPEIKRISTLPVIVDPSHGTGRSHLVGPMSKAAIACGADGLLIEVHPDPSKAWTDGVQTIDPSAFSALMAELEHFARAAHRALRSRS